MAYCPVCRSEFRAGFTKCVSCGDVPLVDVLPEIEELGMQAAEGAVPVGLASDPNLARIVEIEGLKIDLLRVYPLTLAKDLQADLSAGDFASIIVPVPVTFPDMTPRFELRVMPDRQADAEDLLRTKWAEAVAAEGLGEMAAADTEVDECPACGANVPLDVDTCPECGLFVGTAEDTDDQE